MRDAFFEERNGTFVELAAFFCQSNAYDPPIIGVSFACHQTFLFQSVDDAGQIAYGDHHLLSDLAEWEAAGIAESCQNIELRRGEAQLFQAVLQFFVGDEIKAQKADPQTCAIAREEGSLAGRHEKKFRLKDDKKQP